MEGLLNRFIKIVEMVMKDLDESEKENLKTLNHMLQRLENAGLERDGLHVELLDPHGLSQILHPDAVDRDLTNEELARLPVGPDPAVFSK
jgi:C4-type Zn-finger protein